MTTATAGTAAPVRGATPPPRTADIAIDIDLDRLLKRLNLVNTRRVWRDLLERAEHEERTYEYLLTVLVAEAIAIAYRALQNGFDARFVTAAELIDDRSTSFRAGRLADALPAATHPDVVVIDEVG